MIVHIEKQLRKYTNLVQFDVKIWFIDIFEHEERYMFCGEHIEWVRDSS
jgi:hypothetical protein